MKKKSVILLLLCSIPVVISGESLMVNNSNQVSVFDQAKNWISGLYDYNEQEKREAFKQLVVLEQEIQEKKDAYKKIVKTVPDDEKIELQNIFDQDMRDLLQRIIEQKRIIGVAVSPQVRFFWNVMTGLGKLALGGLVIYKVLGDSPQNIYSEKNYYNIKNVKKTDKNVLDTFALLSQQSNDLNREALQQLSQQKNDPNVIVVSPPKNKVNVIVNNNIQSPSTLVPSISADQIDNVANKPAESSVQPLDLPQDQKTDDYGDVFALPQNQGINFNEENPGDIGQKPDQNPQINPQDDTLQDITQFNIDNSPLIDNKIKQQVELTPRQVELYRKQSTNYAVGAVASAAAFIAGRLLPMAAGPGLFFLPVDLVLLAITAASATKSYEKLNAN
jgi:hypothetical protein